MILEQVMKIGIPKELLAEENRVAAVPETVAKMVKNGMEVFVESGAGTRSFFNDEEYEKVGAKIAKDVASIYQMADIILKVQSPTVNLEDHQLEIAAMKENAILIGILQPLLHVDVIKTLNAKKITSFSLDFLPRIARAQAMDVLSSMSNIAGYKSVIMAADYLGKFFPMLTTAAGTIFPAKVLVIGAGVAGLQAIATARRLGAVVTALDTRPPVEEQVKSLGAEFVSLEVTHEQSQDEGGYAKELPPEFYKEEQDIIQKHLQSADVVITSALIPGKRAPLLITEAMVKGMKPGSVIVDLSAAQKGNCALTEPDKIINKYGITIIGILNMPSTMPIHASQLYAKNIWTFLNYIAPEGKEVPFDFADEIIKSTMITYHGEIANPIVKEVLQIKG